MMAAKATGRAATMTNADIFPLIRGQYRARLAETAADVAAAQALRHHSFLARRDLGGEALAQADADGFDAVCLHVLLEKVGDGTLVGCYRLLPLAHGAQIADSYSAQFYDLGALAGFAGPMLELGRFCLHPLWHDPDILRLAWAAMTRLVDAQGVRLLFGCASFEAADPARHAAALALLRGHRAPPGVAPRRKPGRLAVALPQPVPDADPRAAWQGLPALLRSYLAMGGWVSDHAVIDPCLDTLHVLTGVEIARIPPARARLLRADAA